MGGNEEPERQEQQEALSYSGVWTVILGLIAMLFPSESASKPAANGAPSEGARWLRANRPKIIFWTCVAVAGLAVFFSPLALGGSIALAPPDARLPQVRIGLLALVGFAGFWAANTLVREAVERSTTSWWNPCHDLQWIDVWSLVVFQESHDPLCVKPKLRGWQVVTRALLRTFVLAIACWAAIFTVIELIRDPRVPAFANPKGGWDQGFQNLIHASGNLTAYLALLASAITIIFTYHQLRARVRADSRQHWIVRARKLIGEVVALGDAYREYRADGSRRKAQAIWIEMDRMRLELELMLNPSEKDHRLLLYLIQRFVSRGRAAGKPVQDAWNVRRSIAASPVKPPTLPLKPGREEPMPDSNETGGSEPDLGPEWNRIIYASERGELISYILRLSHVVLKREWERVKHTR